MTMRYLLSLGLSFGILHFLVAQPQTRCFEPPSLDFNESSVLFSYLLEDPTISDRCQGIVFDRHRGLTRLKPIDFEDMYVISMGSYSGTVLLGVNKEDNTIRWQKFYNHLNTEHNRAFTVGNFRKRKNDTLEMLTYRTFANYKTNQLNLSGGGFAGRRMINYKTGDMLSDYWVGDSLGVEQETDFRLGFFTTLLDVGPYPVVIPNSDMFYRNSFYRISSDTACYSIQHQYIDSTTLIPYNQNFPHFQLQGIAAPEVLVKCDPEGVSPNVYSFDGPFKLSDGNTYFLKYLKNSKPVIRKLILDDWGNLVQDDDITELTGENNEGHMSIYSNSIKKNDTTMIIVGGVADRPDF